MDQNQCLSAFHHALRTFSTTLSTYGSTQLDRLVLTALSSQIVQEHFVVHMMDEQLYLNAQAQRIADTNDFVRIIFNFSYIPPRISFIPVSFSVLLNVDTGVAKEIVDPHYLNLGPGANRTSEFTVGAIHALRV